MTAKLEYELFHPARHPGKGDGIRVAFEDAGSRTASAAVLGWRAAVFVGARSRPRESRRGCAPLHDRPNPRLPVQGAGALKAP
jgi:hypothetical protein